MITTKDNSFRGFLQRNLSTVLMLKPPSTLLTAMNGTSHGGNTFLFWLSRSWHRVLVVTIVDTITVDSTHTL